LAFCAKLIKSIAPLPILGPKTWLLTSQASTNSFVDKAKAAMKGTGATVHSLRNGGLPDGIAKGDVCVLVAPNTRGDYNAAQALAESNTAKSVVIINGLAKVSKQAWTAILFMFRVCKELSRRNLVFSLSGVIHQIK